MPSLRDRAPGSFPGFAVGDALGATVEFLTPQEIVATHGIHREIIGGGWLNLKPGQVTDDTQMCLALGSDILDSPGGWDLRAAAEAFLAWMQSRPQHLAGPLHHHHALADAAVLALGNITRTFLRGAPSSTDCASRMPSPPRIPTSSSALGRGKPPGYVADTVQTVFNAVFNTDTFEDCLVTAVNRGGDADTIGALAGQLAGALYGVAAIPPRWLKRLDPAGIAEPGERGRIFHE